MSSKGGEGGWRTRGVRYLYILFFVVFSQGNKIYFVAIIYKGKKSLTENTLLPKDELLIPRDLEKWDER